ncbi:MAG: aminotransferase class V-fold PLP-dependent enzyme, partial [Myxococcota bacterium]
VLWVRSDLALEPLAPAGHQERERRPGTENVPGIVGLGAAAEVAAQRLADDGPRIAALTAQLEAGLAGIERTRIHGGSAPRVGNTVNAGFAGALGESVVAALDLAGFSVSTGAACTSGSVEPSPVLLGIGQSPERAREAVRFSLGRATTAEHVAALLAVLPEIVARARRFR